MYLRYAVILLLCLNMGLWIWQKQLPSLPSISELTEAQENDVLDPAVPTIDVIMHANDESTQCSSFGPLRTQLEQQRAVGRIRTFAQTVWIRDSHSVVERGWWVHLPQKPNRAQALKLAEEIATAGIDDYFVPFREYYDTNSFFCRVLV